MTNELACRYCPARFMTAWEHEVHEKEHAERRSNPQCIHIPDGSVVVSGELFDMACAAIAERDKLLADISQAYDLRDKAEGRYCTALGTIEQLHAAVKTAQELAATRLMEIERQKAALVEALNETHTASIEIERLKDDYEQCKAALNDARESNYESECASLVEENKRLRNHGYSPEPCEQRKDSRGFPLSRSGHAIEASCAACGTPLITTDDESFIHDCECMGASRDASSEPCECLIIDKEPSAYHWSNCPRYVAGKL